MWLLIRTLNSILSWPIAISKMVINCVVGNWLRGCWSAFLIFHCEREDYGSNHSLQWISQILNYSVLPSLLIATEGYTPTKHSLWWLLGSCNSHNRSAPEVYIEFLVTTMMYLHDEHGCYTVEPLITRFIIADIKYTTTSTGVGYGSGFELTKDTPYLALTGELWDVFCEYFDEKRSCYKGVLLYHISGNNVHHKVRVY